MKRIGNGEHFTLGAAYLMQDSQLHYLTEFQRLDWLLYGGVLAIFATLVVAWIGLNILLSRSFSKASLALEQRWQALLCQPGGTNDHSPLQQDSPGRALSPEINECRMAISMLDAKSTRILSSVAQLSRSISVLEARSLAVAAAHPRRMESWFADTEPMSNLYMDDWRESMAYPQSAVRQAVPTRVTKVVLTEAISPDLFSGFQGPRQGR